MIFIAPLAIFVAQAVAPDTSPQAAVEVVQSYYGAINRRDFRTAYLAWDQNGAASGQTIAKFRAGFAQTRSVRVVAGAPFNGDAGMSQRTIDVPVEVYAILNGGKRQHFRGKYTLRRVVEGVGAPAGQLRWHLSSASLALVD